MKFKKYFPAAATTLWLVGLMGTAWAQAPLPGARPGDPVDTFGFGHRPGSTQSQVTLAPAPPGPVDPVTGLPIGIDPNTGLPMPAPVPVWIDPDWHPANIWITNVDFDGLPLSEVVKVMREKFGSEFDILPLPNSSDRLGGVDWNSAIISLKMSRANAADLINAMNLVFENNKTPVRWQLKITDGHSFLILKVLPESGPNNTADALKIRRIFFVGDILGDEKSGGMTMDKLINNISDLWRGTYGTNLTAGTDFGNTILFHQETQMLIFNGTQDQMEFVQQILSALKQRSDSLRAKSPLPAAGSNDNLNETKPAVAK